MDTWGNGQGDNQIAHHHHMGTVSTKGNGLLATKDSGIIVVKGWQQTTMATQIGMGMVVVVGVPYMPNGLVGLV
jgi:hypothetical protein